MSLHPSAVFKYFDHLYVVVVKQIIEIVIASNYTLIRIGGIKTRIQSEE
jgi:hypothetical protein